MIDIEMYWDKVRRYVNAKHNMEMTFDRIDHYFYRAPIQDQRENITVALSDYINASREILNLLMEEFQEVIESEVE